VTCDTQGLRITRRRHHKTSFRTIPYATRIGGTGKTPQTRLNSLTVDRFVIQPSQLVYKDISGMHHIYRDFRKMDKYMFVFYIFERHTRIKSRFRSLQSELNNI
jgi:hypothetical protein